MDNQQPEVKLEVLNPRGEISPPPTYSLSPRLDDLNGKTVGLMDNWKSGAVYLQDAFEALLKERYPDIKVVRTTKPQGKPGGGRLLFSTEDWYKDVASQCDAFIFTVGD
ncbi:hypothetical protein HUE98_12975 [Candidatus Contubernalis alkalaceticus]|nr:hypothetical protein HUE98_12975 [Candidatus Contubernalis alkalaceticus]